MQHVIVHAQPLLQGEEGDGGRGDQATSVRPPLGGAELVIDARGSTPFVRGVVG